MREHWTPIAAIDVAVIDPDLLWRVEHMNLLHGAIVKEFAAPEEAIDALTPDHPAVLVLGPRCLTDQVRVALAARRTAPELRIVVCTIAAPTGEDERTRAEGADAVIDMSATDNTFVRIVHDLFLAGRTALGREAERAHPSVIATGDAAQDRSAAPSEPITCPLPRTATLPRLSLVTPAETSVTGPVHHDPPRRAAEVAAPPRRIPVTPDAAPLVPRLVVVTSAKGGEGVSTVALNLACSVASVPRTRTAIVDGDPFFGDIPTDLGQPLRPTPVVHELPIADDVAEQLISRPDEDGPLVVRSPVVGGLLGDRRGEVLRDLVRVAGEHADVVVLDVPVDLLVESRLAADAAVVALVSTRRTTSLKNTMIAARRIRGDNVGLVFNEMDRRHRVAFVEELADEVGLRLLGHLPFNAALRRSASRPRPHEVAESHTRYAREITALRRVIVTHFPALV